MEQPSDIHLATEKQTDVQSASFRIIHATPGHVTYGVWINNGKCGDLTVRLSERIAFEIMMQRGGFALHKRILD